MEKTYLKSKIKHDKNLIDYYRDSKLFKVTDLVVIVLLAITIVLCFVFTIPTTQGSYAVIYHKGTIIGRYSLTNDQNFSILDGKMVITIESNSIRVSESDCKNHICVNSNSISKAGQRIVCTPNKVTIIIESEQDVLITGGVA